MVAINQTPSEDPFAAAFEAGNTVSQRLAAAYQAGEISTADFYFYVAPDDTTDRDPAFMAEHVREFVENMMAPWFRLVGFGSWHEPYGMLEDFDNVRTQWLDGATWDQLFDKWHVRISSRDYRRELGKALVDGEIGASEYLTEVRNNRLALRAAFPYDADDAAAPLSPITFDTPGSPQTLPPSPPQWRDTKSVGNGSRRVPVPSLANAVLAIKALGIEARVDLFKGRITLKHNRTITTVREGILMDDTVGAVRSLINNEFGLDCGEQHTWAAIREIARDNAYDPLLDYLSECQGKWDGRRRIDTWTTDYLGCEDTPLQRAIGRLWLLAAVHRVRHPGCKFDQIWVLEGPEGINKSTVFRVLAGDDYFSDQSILNAGDREVQEQLEGIWIHESADLSGLRKADVERVKAFASRLVDKARPAYGRVREDRPRRCVQGATTNDETYLASQTGNRRFWPSQVGRIDIEALKRDRDLLWGEAATLEAKGASIVLDEKLWAVAAEEQEKRRLVDTWEDLLENMPIEVTVHEGIHTKTVRIIHLDGDKELARGADILCYVLDVPTAQQNPEHGRRLARTMKRLGWQADRFYIGGTRARGFWRDCPNTVPPEWQTWVSATQRLLPPEKARGARDSWVENDGRWERLTARGELIGVAQGGRWWYIFSAQGLLGQAGRPQRFATATDARAQIERLPPEGWEWLTPAALSGDKVQPVTAE